jgi:ATP-binding cassette subfamily F protein 3
MVSHDRHLLRTVIDEFYLVADGRATPFDGDLGDYAKWAAANPKDAPEKPVKASMAKPAPQRNRNSNLKTELAKLDKQLARMHQQKQEIELQLSAADIYDAANKSRLRELLERQNKLKQELDIVETHWLEVSELLQLRGSGSKSG